MAEPVAVDYDAPIVESRYLVPATVELFPHLNNGRSRLSILWTNGQRGKLDGPQAQIREAQGILLQAVKWGKPMITKTNVMFFVGAWMTAIAVRLFAYPFVGPHLADRLGLEAGLLFAVFAFAGTVKRALLIAALTLLWGAGLFYFLDYRRDAVGFAVMAGCGVLAYLLIRPLRHRGVSDNLQTR